MGLTNDVIAFWALALVVPGVLFVAALYLRQMPRRGSKPAQIAERIVGWYGAHPQFALWVLLLALPVTAFILGGVALMRTWDNNPKLQYYTWRALTEVPEHWPALAIGGAVLLAAAVLAMITPHLMANK